MAQNSAPQKGEPPFCTHARGVRPAVDVYHFSLFVASRPQADKLANFIAFAAFNRACNAAIVFPVLADWR